MRNIISPSTEPSASPPVSISFVYLFEYNQQEMTGRNHYILLLKCQEFHPSEAANHQAPEVKCLMADRIPVLHLCARLIQYLIGTTMALELGYHLAFRHWV
jgi:hypothetical protein